MNLVDDPDETINCPPAVCGGRGAGLSGAPVTAQRRHQVTDISPAPAPAVTEYVAQAKECAGCGTVTAGELPAHVRARANWAAAAQDSWFVADGIHYTSTGYAARAHLIAQALAAAFPAKSQRVPRRPGGVVSDGRHRGMSVRVPESTWPGRPGERANDRGQLPGVKSIRSADLPRPTRTMATIRGGKRP